MSVESPERTGSSGPITEPLLQLRGIQKSFGAVHVLRGDGLAERARALCDAIPGAELVDSVAKVGGGALPLLELPGPVVALDPALAAPLRAADPPVLGRVENDRFLLDPRTLTDAEVELVARAVIAGGVGRESAL